MTSSSFSLLATKSATVLRSPTIVSGKRGSHETYLTNVPCTPLDPATEEVVLRVPLDGAMELLQTFVHGDYDILEGDRLQVDGVQYSVRYVGEWDWDRSTSRYRLILLEDLK